MSSTETDKVSELNTWQRVRSRAFLFSVALMRRMTLGARGVLVDGENVFLIKHGYLPGWQFPGGGVEPGETAEEAMAREMEEETGYRVTDRAILIGFYHNRSRVTVRDHVAFYLCREFEKVRDVTPNYEIAGAQWFNRHALPPDTTKATHRRIAEIFDGAPISPTW